MARPTEPPKAILHLDADAFFASVEQAADPRLRGRPIAVGGEKRGIIAAASYEARRFGVHTPMPTARARKLCPKLIILPGDYEKYERFSRWMFSYAYDFTPDVEITSIDEGYFDLTGTRKPPGEIAEILRQAIGQGLKITVSEGLGANKLVSQIASKLHKPATFLQVPPGRESVFLQPLPHHWLPGIGPVTAGRLQAAGLSRIGQLAGTPIDLLELLLGSQAPQIHAFARGIDDRPVIPARAPALSYGSQETFPVDVTDDEYLQAVLQRMADRLMAKVRADGKSVRTLTVRVRYNDMQEDQRSESLPEPTDLETDLYGRLRTMLRTAWKRRVSVRLIGLKLSNVYAGPLHMDLPLDRACGERDPRHRLALLVDELRRTRGAETILRGHDLRLRERPETYTAAPSAPVAPRTRGRRISTGVSGAGIGRAFQERVSEAKSNPGARAPVIHREAPWFPLNLHSYYSFLNSTLSPTDLVAWATERQLSTIALTDQGNLHGAIPFAKAAAQAGIRPVIGVEIPWREAPLKLYVQDETGYRNLCALLSRESPGEGRPPLELPHPEALEGLLALCTDPRAARWFPGRFYQEIRSPRALTAGHRDTSLPLAVSCPIHYATPSDRLKYDILQSIRTRTLLRQPHPDKQLRGALHLREPGPVREAFQSWPEALYGTAELLDRCHFQPPFGPPQFPAYRTPDGSSSGAFLRRLVLEGLRRRYPSDWEKHRAQVEEELGIIQEVGYEDYFLIVWELLQDCRAAGIEWITRGSAADSLVCFCLGISGVCPIRFQLYFRRFLNRDRMRLNKLPDIDIDFPHDRKDDVVDLVFRRHGQGHAAVVGGFSTFQARGAMGDVAKVLGVSEHQIRRFTEHLPYGGARDLEATVRNHLECRDLPIDEEPYLTALRTASFLDGFPRYAKMHPCGVVLSRQPILELTPTFRSRKGLPTTHFDMDAVEDLGLVKIDVLAQGGLAVMRDARAALRHQGWEIDLDHCRVLRRPGDITSSPVPRQDEGKVPATLSTGSSMAWLPAVPEDDRAWKDPRVWSLIAGGGSRAVHHIESPAMVGLCRMCNVRDIDGLVAIVSVIRPGAANENKKNAFARRYQGMEPVSFPHPSLEKALGDSFGLMVYEEHVLQACEAFAGLDPGRADILRRALNKQKMEVIGEIRLEFETSARKRGRAPEDIARVWELVSGFAGYAFCKAHSTAYGVEAYQSAWLKRYFPAEFMAAVLSNGKGFYHPLVYVLECHRLGIRMLPPCIRQPGPDYQAVPWGPTSQGRAIRVPVARIKGLAESTLERLYHSFAQDGPFESLQDFYRRVHPQSGELDLLLRAGALDGFHGHRAELYWQCRFLERAYGHGDHPDQGWLLPEPDARRLPEVPLEEPTPLQRLQWEEELLGFTASGHPLDLHPDIAWETYCPVSRLGRHIGETVVTCGLVIEQRLHHQVTGEPMKFLTLADPTGMIETELFAKTYRSHGLATVRYPVLEVTATVEPFENRRGHALRVHHAGPPRKKDQ